MMTIAFIIAGVVVVTVIAPLLSIPLAPLAVFGRANYRIAPIPTALIAGISMAAAMLLLVMFVKSVGRQPSVWIFLIPYLLVLRNDLDRISRAWTGDTPVRLKLEAAGEVYNSRLQAHMEVGSLIGDTIGMWAVFLFIPF